MAGSAFAKKKSDEGGEDWLGTFADTVCLLMTFFIMLLSMADFDKGKFEQAATGFAKDIGGREVVTPIQSLKVDVQDVLYTLNADEAASVSTESDGLVLEFASSALYRPGRADIRDEAKTLVEKLAQTFLSPRYMSFFLEVEGHTDDIPISTAQFPSNWELSASRATHIVRFLIDQGIETSRLKAVGYGETRPKVPNRGADGRPIKENQAENRRIVVRIKPNPELYKIPNIDRRKSGAVTSEGETQPADAPVQSGQPTAQPGQPAPMAPTGVPSTAPAQPGQSTAPGMAPPAPAAPAPPPAAKAAPTPAQPAAKAAPAKK